MQISNDVIAFIDAHEAELKSPNIEKQLQVVLQAEAELMHHLFVEFMEVIDIAGYDTLQLRQRAIVRAISEYCDVCLADQVVRAQDPSNSWSRLQYTVDGVGEYLLDYDEIVDAVKIYGGKYNLKLNPLPDDCGWEGAGDYDLGWFNIATFRRLFPNG